MCRWFWKNEKPLSLTALITSLALSDSFPRGDTSTAKYGLPFHSLYAKSPSVLGAGRRFASSRPNSRISGFSSSELKLLIMSSSVFLKGSGPVKPLTSA